MVITVNTGIYRNLFGFHGDGKLDGAERALEYMNFRAVMGEEGGAATMTGMMQTAILRSLAGVTAMICA